MKSPLEATRAKCGEACDLLQRVNQYVEMIESAQEAQPYDWRKHGDAVAVVEMLKEVLDGTDF